MTSNISIEHDEEYVYQLSCKYVDFATVDVDTYIQIHLPLVSRIELKSCKSLEAFPFASFNFANIYLTYIHLNRVCLPASFLIGIGNSTTTLTTLRLDAVWISCQASFDHFVHQCDSLQSAFLINCMGLFPTQILAASLRKCNSVVCINVFGSPPIDDFCSTLCQNNDNLNDITLRGGRVRNGIHVLTSLSKLPHLRILILECSDFSNTTDFTLIPTTAFPSLRSLHMNFCKLVSFDFLTPWLSSNKCQLANLSLLYNYTLDVRLLKQAIKINWKLQRVSVDRKVSDYHDLHRVLNMPRKLQAQIFTLVSSKQCSRLAKRCALKRMPKELFIMLIHMSCSALWHIAKHDVSKQGAVLREVMLHPIHGKAFRHYATQIHAEEGIAFFDEISSLNGGNKRDAKYLIEKYFINDAIHWVHLSAQTRTQLFIQYNSSFTHLFQLFENVMVEIFTDLKQSDTLRGFLSQHAIIKTFAKQIDAFTMQRFIIKQNKPVISLLIDDLSDKQNVDLLAIQFCILMSEYPNVDHATKRDIHKLHKLLTRDTSSHQTLYTQCIQDLTKCEPLLLMSRIGKYASLIYADVELSLYHKPERYIHTKHLLQLIDADNEVILQHLIELEARNIFCFTRLFEQIDIPRYQVHKLHFLIDVWKYMQFKDLSVKKHNEQIIITKYLSTLSIEPLILVHEPITYLNDTQNYDFNTMFSGLYKKAFREVTYNDKTVKFINDVLKLLLRESIRLYQQQ